LEIEAIIQDPEKNGPAAPGLVAGRLLPVTVTMLFFFGWPGMWGEQVGIFGTKFGAAIFAALNVVVFATALILCL
jgi:hypothetical protein